MIPLVPGRLHVLKAAGETVSFRRKEGETYKKKELKNIMIYIGPHPDQPHLALLRNAEDQDWYYWDVPENFDALDDVAEESRIGPFRATRPADAHWGRKET